jgi:hypothetical protein
MSHNSRWLTSFVALAFLSLIGPVAELQSEEPGATGRDGGAIGTSNVDLTEQDIWRTQNRCGVNSLYVFLRLSGQSASYDDLLRRVPVGKSGTSMADLKRLVSADDIPCSVIRTTPENLPDQRLPAIAYVWNASLNNGHFVVLTHASQKSVRFIDGTAGNASVETMNKFAKRWDGHLLVRTDRDQTATYLWCAIGGLGLGLVGQSIFVRLREISRAGFNSRSTIRKG